ncbi:hypothetical protein [Thiomonas sp.]
MRLFSAPRCRTRYWSCSTLANRLYAQAGVPKPEAATMEDWKAWRTEAQGRHPFLYALIETWFERLQDLCYFPTDVLEEARHQWLNRVTRSHTLPSDLKPGGYYDLDTVLLHSLFTALVDFVEIEKAARRTSSIEDRHSLPWWARHRFLRWKPWRSPKDGLAYLAWEAGLDDPELAEHLRSPAQARVAREILALYHWWKIERPARTDPHDASGWSAWCENHPPFANDRTPEDRDERFRILERLRELESQYQEEDTDRLIRLIRIRSELWT